MKFGRQLAHIQVPGWEKGYIDYKSLKKLIKAAAQASQNGEKVDLAEFFFALDRNLETVDSFYNKKYSDGCRRLKLLQDRYGMLPDVRDLDKDESEELLGALLELRAQFRTLLLFGGLNRQGFLKITKKLDKKVPHSATQHRYIATKVDPKPFAKDNTIVRLVGDLNKWIEAVGDDGNARIDDNHSDRSIRSLERASSRAVLSVPSALLDQLDQATRDDDVNALEARLAETNLTLTDDASQNLLHNLLQRSISARSKRSLEYLLAHIQTLHEPYDIHERNCIHRLVIHIGRTKHVKTGEKEAPAYPFPAGNHYASQYMTPAASPAPPEAEQEEKLLTKSDEAVDTLIYLLEKLREDQRSALLISDSFGRLPLHYAAQFGFVVVCKIIMQKMQEWGMFHVEEGIDAPEWQDKEGNAPLHLSVIGGHALTTQALLQGENWQGRSEDKSAMRREVSKSSAVLAIAVKSNFKRIVRLLVDAGVDINWQDSSGETALHIAARFGHDECARILIEGSEEQRADLNAVDKTFNWTPLHIAAVDGHFLAAKLLVEAGADVDKLDSSGWTAKEHASLRGHMPIARLLKEHTIVDEIVSNPSVNREDSQGRSSSPSSSPPEVSSLGDRRSNGTSRAAEPVKTFGHRYLKDESLVLVSLGTMDMRKDVDAIKLDRVPLTEAHTTELDTALSVLVSAQGAQGEPTIIDLPLHENVSTEPIVFTCKNAVDVKLLFDIVPTYSGNGKNKIGRGVALLSTIRPSVGSKRMNLQGDVCVPVVSSASLEVIGTVNFNFLVVTPFSHPNMEVTSQQTYWKKLASTMVIGHRGLGKNVTSNRSLQLGENTVESFIAAANLGAQYVEFDVQLTKDHVPVIYHDFLVSETGIDAPVHTLTLEQFLHINPDARRLNGKEILNQTIQQQQHTLALANGSGANGSATIHLPTSGPLGPRQRSMSVGYGAPPTGSLASERMKHTRDFKEKGYKGNSRGNFIQAPFATLEDLFRDLPPGVGFNIEMKYPMLHESEEHDMDAYAVELNSFCDTVLTKVYDLRTASRHIIFSSFNPDICLCLSFKQPNFPIMFLTDAGTSPVGDVRASSLQEAIRFASRWNLLGIVSNTEPFTNSPRLVRVVKQHGLVCVSYGAENNDSLMVQRQVKEGIDAVIVDSVLAIRKGLTEHESKALNGALSPSPPDANEAAEVVEDVLYENGGVKIAN